VPLLPIDSVSTAETKTKYCYFNPDNDINKKATTIEEMLILKSYEMDENLTPIYTSGAEKINTLKISKSNYFNAC
jgi:hypothetical protein